MPQLPSGKHVAISPAPLHDLLAHADHFGIVHKVLEIRTQTDMRRYIEVYFLASKDDAGARSGFTLADWDQLTSGWSLADQVAMREFVDGRAAPLLKKCTEAVRDAQERLRQSGEFLPRLLTEWHDAGIHPLQEDEREK